MDELYDLKPARKVFSRIGLAFCAILAVATVAQLAWVLIPQLIWGEDNWMATSSWGFWLTSFVPLYAFAIPAGLLLLRKLPAQKPQEHKLPFTSFLVIFPVCVFFMISGSLLGNILSALLSGGTAENALNEYAMDTNPLKVVVMVILAPLLEEYVCRKQIIDRTLPYGEKTAVVLSAAVFGLLHQNLFQFFYAFALGLVFGYIYIRTGRLRYTVVLHAIVNFMGSVIAPWVLQLADMEAIAGMDPTMPTEQLIAVYMEILPGLLALLGYLFLYYGLAFAGFVLLIVMWRKQQWKSIDTQLPKGTAFRTVYLNVGMILYVLICVATTVLALL